MERYDAALLHVYDYKENNGQNSVRERPGLRSRLVVAAARLLFKNNQVDQFVLSGGAALGKTEALSTLSADHLVRTGHIDHNSVKTNRSAQVTTSKELETLKDEALVSSWSNTVSIGWELHRNRIQMLANKILPKAKIDHKVLTAEQVLSTYPSERNAKRYESIIDAIHNSEGELRWQSYEKRMMLVMRIPFATQLLDFVAKIYRPKAD
ncbi:MAG: hypothetical protein Q8P25_01715 [Candidatus Curtissbacteria bacterium]|nr:hypothetical protein [Candidatus Curtissbacteria bacterium]